MDEKEIEWKALELPDLAEKEKALRKELFNLMFQKTMGQIANPMRISHVRRDIARALTFIRQKRS